MDNKSSFETYLYISQKKLNISVIQINNLYKVYEKELIIENNLDKKDQMLKEIDFFIKELKSGTKV